MLVYRYYRTFAARDLAIDYATSHLDFKLGACFHIGFYKERGGYAHCSSLGPQKLLVYEYAGSSDVVELVSVERNFEISTVEDVRPPKPTEWPSRSQPAAVPGWRYNFTDLVWEEAGVFEEKSLELVDLMCWRNKSTGHLVWALADYLGFATHVGPNMFVLDS